MTAQQAADTLNELLKIDPACTNALFQIVRSCNKIVADHPTIQCHIHDDGKPEERYTVSFLGLLNGLLLSAGSTDVVAKVVDDDANQNVIGFINRPYSDFFPEVEATCQD